MLLATAQAGTVELDVYIYAYVHTHTCVCMCTWTEDQLPYSWFLSTLPQ